MLQAQSKDPYEEAEEEIAIDKALLGAAVMALIARDRLTHFRDLLKAPGDPDQTGDDATAFLALQTWLHLDLARGGLPQFLFLLNRAIFLMGENLRVKSTARRGAQTDTRCKDAYASAIV